MSPRLVHAAIALALWAVGFASFAEASRAAGLLPVMKRLTGADTYDLQHADSRSNSGTVDPTVKAQFNSRFQSLVMFESPDWATSYLPRQWHPNGWVYRKSTSYLVSHNVHTQYPQYFVKLKGTTDFASIDYDCNPERGCTQPMLDVTSEAARKFWLYGPDGVVNASSTCQSHLGNQTDGVLDELVCGYKGVWLDDVLADLLEGGPNNPNSNTAVANLRTGVIVPTSGLGTTFPYTVAQWSAGLATMLEQLRAGINTLKNAGRIKATSGIVAINYKWSTFGFSQVARTGATPSYNPNSNGARIIRAADLVELEGGYIDDGLVPGPVQQDWTFNRRRAFVQAVHGLGRFVIEEKTNSADIDPYGALSCQRDIATQDAAHQAAHFATANYNYAATLLDYQPGDWVGDICEYHTGGPGQFGGQWPGYNGITNQTLGTPTGAWYVQPGTQLQRRDFTLGYILVGPPGVATTTFNFTKPRGILSDRFGTLLRANRTSIQVGARQAVMVRFSQY